MNIFDISAAFNGLEQPLRLIISNNTVQQGINIPSKQVLNIVGVIQPLDLRSLKITPAEQIEYGTHMVHIRQSLLQINNINLLTSKSTTYNIIYNNNTFKVIGKWLYNDYGYAEADAVQTAK